MFPTRFFPDRYFAPRFWPKVGDDVDAVAAYVDLTVEIDGLLTREVEVDGVQSLYLEVDGTVTREVEVLT